MSVNNQLEVEWKGQPFCQAALGWNIGFSYLQTQTETAILRSQVCQHLEWNYAINSPESLTC
jgi:hypothetical protein